MAVNFGRETDLARLRPIVADSLFFAEQTLMFAMNFRQKKAMSG
jgi:hypothetical protein